MEEKTIRRRLANIKYLYTQGMEQSYKPESLAWISILTFHDAIELFLQFTSEYLDIGKTQVKFLEYWDLINSKLGKSQLTAKESMRRLNRARVSLKHHGIYPSTLDLEGFRAEAANFFKDNTQLVFNIEFDEISMTDLIDNKDIVERIKEAELLNTQGNTSDALIEIAVAFSLVMKDYEDRIEKVAGYSPFSVIEDTESITSIGRYYWDKDEHDLEGKFGELVDNINNSIDSIREVVKILGLGIDFNRYIKFISLTPAIYWSRSGQSHASWRMRTRADDAKEDDVRFCIEFVIESAINSQSILGRI